MPDAAIEAERRRIELTRATSSSAAPISRASGRAGYVVNKAGDTAADLIRFTAYRAEPHEGGLRVAYKTFAAREVAWTDVVEITVRQLPADPPWDLSLIVDFRLAQDSAPIRLLTGTFIAFKALPGGASTSPVENVRRLCLYARERHPGIAFEPATERYVLEGAPCQRFASMRQFAEYDARYG
jgi:hypothetical protein